MIVRPSVRMLLVLSLTGLLFLSSGVAVSADVDHKHPDDVEDDSDLPVVERWLGNRMGEIHADCSEDLSLGDFDACEDLDGEYPSYLERYVTIRGETGGTNENATAERFEETQEQQREYVALLREFNQTYEDYRAARAAGDEARARELARKLQRLADRIEALGGDIEFNFRVLDSGTDVGLSEAANDTNESTRRIQTIVVTVEGETFTPSVLTARVDSRTSFADPSVVHGRLVTENGTAIANGRVVVTDGFQRSRGRTNSTGYFSITYRPTRVPVGETTIDVRYRPAARAPYLGSSTAAETVVEATESTLDVTNSTTTARFGKTVTVDGTVRAAGRGAADVPTVVRVNGRQLGETRTRDDGTFHAEFTFPADIPAEATELDVQASRADRAVAPSQASTALSVESTQTDLAVVASAENGDIVVSGRLTTTDGASPGARPITIRAGNETYQRTTAESGRYSVRVDDTGEPERVTVRYDEAGSNLGASENSTRISYPESNARRLGSLSLIGEVVSFIQANPIVAVGVTLAGVGVLLIGAFLALRRWRGGPGRVGEESGPEPDSDPSIDGRDGSIVTHETGRGLIAQAKDRVDEDPDSAIRMAYGGVRAELSNDRDAQTHWEFYNHVSSDLEEAQDAAFRSLTTSFESAVFAFEDTGIEDAKNAIGNAEKSMPVASTDGSEDPSADREQSATNTE